MSSVANVAAAAAANSQAQVQSALATKFTKMNADSAQSIVALLEAGSANLEKVSKGSLASGVGQNVDISA